MMTAFSAMGYSRQSYSPLKQINRSSIKKLVPVWSTSLMNESGELAAPTVYDGVMYVINGKWTFAIDVETGRQIWRTPVEIDPDMNHDDHKEKEEQTTHELSSS